MISPFAKQGFVDQILKFVEDNGNLPKISGSFDAIAATLNKLFDFRRGRDDRRSKLFIDPVTGQEMTPDR